MVMDDTIFENEMLPCLKTTQLDELRASSWTMQSKTIMLYDCGLSLKEDMQTQLSNFLLQFN